MSSVPTTEQTQPAAIPRGLGTSRSRWRRRTVVGAVVALAMLVWLCFYVTTAWKRELQKAIAEADRLDPGWRFEDLEAAREPVAGAENSAPIVLAAAALVPPKWGTVELPSGMTLESRLASLQPSQPLDEADLNVLRAAPAKVTAALDKARELADRPRGRYRVAWSADLVGTLMPHLDHPRTLVRILTIDALLRSRDGDADGAVRSCRAALNAGRSLGDEPAAVSQLVRVSCDLAAVRTLERSLATGTASAKTLEEMQALLADEDAQPLMLRTVRAVRADYFQALEVLRTGRFNRAAFGLTSSWLGPTADEFIDQQRARGSEAAYLRWSNTLVEIGKQPTETHHQKLRELGTPAQQLPPLIAALSRGSDMATPARAINRAHAELRCATTALAAVRYRQVEHHWPASPDALVPRYLDAVPADPFDGRPIRWCRRKDGLVIYSVGPDRTDNGGNLDRQHPDQPGTDVGFQLRDDPGSRAPIVKDP